MWETVRNINTQGHSRLQQPSHCEKKQKKISLFFLIFKGMHLSKILSQFKVGYIIENLITVPWYLQMLYRCTFWSHINTLSCNAQTNIAPYFHNFGFHLCLIYKSDRWISKVQTQPFLNKDGNQWAESYVNTPMKTDSQSRIQFQQ